MVPWQQLFTNSYFMVSHTQDGKFWMCEVSDLQRKLINSGLSLSQVAIFWNAYHPFTLSCERSAKAYLAFSTTQICLITRCCLRKSKNNNKNNHYNHNPNHSYKYMSYLCHFLSTVESTSTWQHKHQNLTAEEWKQVTWSDESHRHFTAYQT